MRRALRKALRLQSSGAGVPRRTGTCFCSGRVSRPLQALRRASCARGEVDRPDHVGRPSGAPIRSSTPRRHRGPRQLRRARAATSARRPWRSDPELLLVPIRSSPGLGRWVSPDATSSQRVPTWRGLTYDRAVSTNVRQAGPVGQDRGGPAARRDIIAVFDCIGAGTGFVGLTDLRVILQDNSFVGKKIALTSVPYNRVQAVSFVSNKSMLGKWSSTSEIAILVGGKEQSASSAATRRPSRPRRDPPPPDLRSALRRSPSSVRWPWSLLVLLHVIGCM